MTENYRMKNKDVKVDADLIGVNRVTIKRWIPVSFYMRFLLLFVSPEISIDRDPETEEMTVTTVKRFRGTVYIRKVERYIPND